MKRHLPFAAVLILMLAAFCYAQPEATPSPTPKPKKPPVTKDMLQKQLADNETALWNAWKNKDMGPFETHLSADSVVIDSNGVFGKSMISEGMKTCDIKSFSLSDWKLIKLSASTALLTY